MSPYFATAVLIGFITVLLALPLTPGVLELYRKSDASPLVVVQQNAGDVRFFADGFRSYLNAIQPALHECLASGNDLTVTMPDGDTCIVLGAASSFATGTRTCSEVVVSGSDLELPPETTFLKDIYTAGHFSGGSNNQYRAILGDKDVHLSAGSTVMRWVHAVGDVAADSNCKLYGRVSAQRSIRLQAGCNFLRLNAPRIATGERDAEVHAATVLDDTFAPSTERHLRDGDFAIPAGELFHGSLVVRGDLRIGAGAQIYGSVKCGRQLTVEEGVLVTGSLISAADMKVGPRGVIRGPVIAESSVYLTRGTQCGSGVCPTTVSAPEITVEEGVVVFGTVWAREHGRVVKSL
jgi:cytoskeletal protein CcmA (bactofilin family)